MKKRFLPILATALFATAVLVGCGETDYTVAITNKDALTAEWHVKDAARKVDFTVSPEINYDDAYKAGNLKVVSSKPEIVSVNKYMISPVAAGSSDVSVEYTYNGKTALDKVTITVAAEQGEPAMKDATVKEVIDAIADNNQHKQKYHITGVVKAWQSGKTDGGDYGNLYINDGTAEGDGLYVYGCTATASSLVWNNESKKYEFTNPKDFKTNDVTKVIKIGDTLEMEIDTLMYNTTKEAEGIVKKVTPAPGVLPTKIEIDKVPDEIEVGYYYPASLKFEPAECNEKDVTWASADAEKAGVDKKGGVYGVAAADAVKITATSVKAPTVAGEKTVKVIANKNPECEPQDLAAGDFKGGCVQSTNHKNIYLKASITDKGYIETTTKGGSEGLTFTVVPSNSNFVIKVGDKYLGYDSSLSGKIKLVDALTDALEFSMVEGTKVVKTVIGSGDDATDYTLATYGTYETFGLSKLSYVLDDNKNVIPSQNPLHLYVKDAPKDPSVPEPALVTDKTLAEIIAVPKEQEMTKKYEISVKVKDLGSSKSGADKYGTLYVTDLEGNNEVLVYGATATATALAWDNVSKYSFKNPQDFLTNSMTQNIGVNDILKMHIVKTSYGDTNEIEGIVLEVTPGTRPTLTGIDIKGESEVEVDKTVTLKAAPVPYSATLGDVTWSIKSGESYVSLPETKTGASIVVTGVAAGEAVLTATCGTFTKDFTLTVKEAGNKLVLDFTKENTAPKEADKADGVEFIMDGITYVTNKGFQHLSSGKNDYFFVKNGDNACFWNKTPFANDLASISVTVGSGASASAIYSLTYGSSMLSGQQAQQSPSDEYKIPKGTTKTFNISGTGVKYFNFSAYGANCQFVKIVFNFVEA